MQSRRSPLNVSRGLRGSLLCALVGAVAPLVMVSAFLVFNWIVFGVSEWDRHYDIQQWKHQMLGVIIGVSVVFACAGWAKFAPMGTYRFARSLAFVFLVSVPLWFVLGMARDLLDLNPRKPKKLDEPKFYPSELLMMIGPPIVAATILTTIRGANALKSSPKHDVRSAVNDP